MRQSKANAYDTDWEYELLRKQERKKTKELRKQRKGRRTQWELAE